MWHPLVTTPLVVTSSVKLAVIDMGCVDLGDFPQDEPQIAPRLSLVKLGVRKAYSF